MPFWTVEQDCARNQFAAKKYFIDTSLCDHVSYNSAATSVFHFILKKLLENDFWQELCKPNQMFKQGREFGYCSQY